MIDAILKTTIIFMLFCENINYKMNKEKYGIPIEKIYVFFRFIKISKILNFQKF